VIRWRGKRSTGVFFYKPPCPKPKPVESMQEERLPKFEDFVEPDIPMNSSHTVGLTNRLKRDPRSSGLGCFELINSHGKGNREELLKKATELAILLRMKHGYTFDVDMLVDTLLHLRKAGFMDGLITAFYFTTPQPLILESADVYGEPLNYLLVAPRIDE